MRLVSEGIGRPVFILVPARDRPDGCNYRQSHSPQSNRTRTGTSPAGSRTSDYKRESWLSEQWGPSSVNRHAPAAEVPSNDTTLSPLFCQGGSVAIEYY